ncbi:MAG: hypothetical protein R3E42_13110 [Burkholderiaceae bacterium]
MIERSQERRPTDIAGLCNEGLSHQGAFGFFATLDKEGKKAAMRPLAEHSTATPFDQVQWLRFPGLL